MAAIVAADIVRQALEIVGINNTGNVNTRQTTRFMNANQLDEMTDFKTLDVSNVKEMVKQYQRVAGATALGIRVQNNLQGLIWYARDKERRGLTVDVAVLNEDILIEAREDYQMYLKDYEDGKSAELEKFNEKSDFADWDDSVTETLGRKMGAFQAPMDYLVRETQPAGFVPRNPKEALKYALPFLGRKYEKDNSLLFSMLNVAVLNTPAWTYVNAFKTTLDGRAAMTALRNHYDGDASNNKKLVKYQNIVAHSEYHSERTATWETISTNLVRAYQWLELRKGQTYTDEVKVMKLASMIKVGGNAALGISIEFMKNSHRDNFAQALIYITTRINELNANSKSSAATRQISSTERQKKCNGVDISDPFRKFTSDEWHQLQQHGQNLVQQYRTGTDPQGGGRGGRGGRGRGRGGRGYYNNNGGRGHGGYGYGGRGGGRGGRFGSRGGRGGRGGRSRGNGDNRNVNQVQSDTKESDKNPEDTMKKEQSSQSNVKGGNAGSAFSK